MINSGWRWLCMVHGAWCIVVHVLFLMDGGGWWVLVVHDGWGWCIFWWWLCMCSNWEEQIFSPPTGECQVVGGINRGKWFCIKIIAFASNFDIWHQIEIFFLQHICSQRLEYFRPWQVSCGEGINREKWFCAKIIAFINRESCLPRKYIFVKLTKIVKSWKLLTKSEMTKASDKNSNAKSIWKHEKPQAFDKTDL